MPKSKPLAMMIGATNHSDDTREINDYYATEPKALEILLEHQEIAYKVWESACGEGHLSKVLHKKLPISSQSNQIRSTDLIDRGYGEVLDFYSVDEPWDGDIITNPPFKNVEKFIRHGLKLLTKRNRLIIFCRIHLLESTKRYKLFQEYPPETVWVHSGRIGTAMNGDFEKYKAKAMCYAWFVWRKGSKKQTVLKWLPPETTGKSPDPPVFYYENVWERMTKDLKEKRK
jgi:hypothetical protein